MLHFFSFPVNSPDFWLSSGMTTFTTLYRRQPHLVILNVIHVSFGAQNSFDKTSNTVMYFGFNTPPEQAKSPFTTSISSMLWQIYKDSSNTVLIIKNGVTQEWVPTHSRATAMFSMWTIWISSAWGCHSVHSDAWCKWALKPSELLFGDFWFGYQFTYQMGYSKLIQSLENVIWWYFSSTMQLKFCTVFEWYYVDVEEDHLWDSMIIEKTQIILCFITDDRHLASNLY